MKVQAPRRPPECLISGWRLREGSSVGRFDFVLDL